MQQLRIKRYRGKYEYSYTLGMAPTIELILHRPQSIYKIYVHSEYRQEDDSINIYEFCNEHGVSCETSDRVIQRVANRGNVYVLGVFYKYTDTLASHQPHVLLVNPSNTGNLGTILRTGLGFGFDNLGIITPGVDHFHPSTVRASMGALFSSQVALFDSVEEYRAAFPHHVFYSFMLEGAKSLKQTPPPTSPQFSLVFGNESTGLPEEYLQYGPSVYIQHEDTIDSLNLSIAFGIAAHHFAKE